MGTVILAEHLKEKMNGRKVRAAVFHTFNFEPDFFENYLLPLFFPDIPFGENRIQNAILWRKFQHELPPITVYCDFHAKAQKGINLDYVVRTIDIPKVAGVKPCFHPKHSFILLEDWELLVVTGSNNITEAGWCSNLEGFSYLSLKSNEFFPRKFKDELKEYLRDLRNTFFNERFDETESWSKADNEIDRFFRQVGYTNQNPNLYYFNSARRNEFHDGTFVSFIKFIKDELNKGLPFQRVNVISPYYPTSSGLFKEFKDLTECADISFSLPFENVDVVAIDKVLYEEVASMGINWKEVNDVEATKGYRRNHSKVYELIGDSKVFTIVGSVNFTNMAWKGVKNGGNYESAILYVTDKTDYQEHDLLKPCDISTLTFTEPKPEEQISEDREDAYDLRFILDWSAKTLEVINENEDNQRGYISGGNFSNISINGSRIVRLSEEQLRYFANRPLIPVKPSGKDTIFYYYPIHNNIEAMPMPERLVLNDVELLELWKSIEQDDDPLLSLQLIDRFIDRITDEAGDIQEATLIENHSTLNIMATHINGLLALQKRLFTEKGLKQYREHTRKLREYYLLANNVDTLYGYRKLLKKMESEGKLNEGFYWLLLNIIDLFFYMNVEADDFQLEDSFDKILSIHKELATEIQNVSKKMIGKDLTKNHLKWALKMIKDEVAR
ncbi:hypothetical protein E4S40_02335 [Algoriphagus kandeliae]|uniref:Uncharacterized protein n=1 Tax=Algoriphagus kandeliae TaxID=2562278 RepID=A0A4Y9QYE3_9BACT|nr:hypothetical protein [Algoriphagus kandeliae]TFV97514.1 hypothetical protein E4S40_02335 [Algoriphagus kandeliae]